MREATVQDVERMAGWLESRGVFTEEANAWQQERVIRVVLRYSRRTFGDVQPGMSAAYTVLTNLEDFADPYSIGGFYLTAIADAAWTIGNDEGYREGWEEAEANQVL